MVATRDEKSSNQLVAQMRRHRALPIWYMPVHRILIGTTKTVATDAHISAVSKYLEALLQGTAWRGPMQRGQK